jgi:hypothetical protein
MALIGDLSTLALSDLLYIFKLRGLTGRLTIQNEVEEAQLHFRRGQLVYASSGDAGHRLGQMLVCIGKINLDQLGRALALQTAGYGGMALGEILVQQGWLTPEELFESLSQQVEELLYHVLTWPTGSFSFTPTTTGLLRQPLRDFNIEQIILEATRRADELAAIRQLIPSLDCGAVVLRDPTSIPFTDSSRLKARIIIASLMEGATNLRQVIRATGLSEEEVIRIVYQLVRSEVLAIAQPPTAAPVISQHALNGRQPQPTGH